MIELRLRNTISDGELEQKVGKIVTAADYNLLLTGPCKVAKPNGSLLAVYLPGALSQVIDEHPKTYDVLHSLRFMKTDNRGFASGTPRLRYEGERRTRTLPVASTILGAFDAKAAKQFCRLTSWTGKHLPQWQSLIPFFASIAREMEQHAPERYAAQQAQANKTDPAWVIPGTPFTTITVNNTYPTGVHTDSGDLDAGLSTLAVLRRGNYTGGHIVLPKFRIAADLQDGDLIMFDAHEFHGNTAIRTESDDAERISVVSYYRTGMVRCGSAEDEYRKAVLYAERRGGIERGSSGTTGRDTEEAGDARH